MDDRCLFDRSVVSTSPCHKFPFANLRAAFPFSYPTEGVEVVEQLFIGWMEGMLKSEKLSKEQKKVCFVFLSHVWMTTDQP